MGIGFTYYCKNCGRSRYRSDNDAESPAPTAPFADIIPDGIEHFLRDLTPDVLHFFFNRLQEFV